MEQYILYGCGGFAIEIAEYLKEIGNGRISDVVDQGRGRFDDLCTVSGYEPQLHASLETIADKQDKCALICLGDPTLRSQKLAELREAGIALGSLVHPTAWIAPSASIGDGAIVCPFVFVGPMARLGVNCVLNVRATIGHDAVLGDSCVISPHADLNGATRCGEAVLVSACVVVDPGKSIGAYARIGSGSVVKQDIGDGFLAYGNPAKGRQMYRLPEHVKRTGQ